MSTSPYLPADDPRAGSCGSCGSPMATDQRYCLSCGARREHARLPFQSAVVPYGQSVAGPPQGVAPALWSAPPGVGQGPATGTLLAALACVLLAFGVGVLVGDDGGGAQQPIVVGGAPAAAVAPVAATTSEATTSTADESASTDDAADPKDTSVTKIDKSKLDATQKKEAEEIEKTPATTPKPVTIPKSTEKDLNSKDPDKARDASRALPDAVSTGG